MEQIIQASRRERLVWIDYSKALLIYLMIVCHIGAPQYLDTTIVSFHMSAFFVLSGLLHKRENLADTLKHSVKRLLIPVLFFELIGYCFWCIWHSDIPFSLITHVIKPILGLVILNPAKATVCCGPMWFCISLFIVKCIVSTARHKFSVLITAGLLLSFALSVAPTFTGRDFIGRAFLALFFYSFGAVMKSSVAKIRPFSSKRKLLMQFLSMLALPVLAIFNERCSYLAYSFGHTIWIFYVTGILGFFGVFLLFDHPLFKRNKLIEYISSNTLTIMGVHLIFVHYLPPPKIHNV